MELPFQVHIDAANKALSRVQMWVIHSITKSRKLDEIEQWYSTHEKMSIVTQNLEHWKQYLMSAKFVMVMDIVANTYF